MPVHTDQKAVCVLGQWASGKSAATRLLLEYLGGESKAVFLSDRDDVTRQAVNYMLDRMETQVTVYYEEDGRKRLESDLVSIWLYPGEDLHTVNLSQLNWSADDSLLPAWLDQGRINLGHRICQSRSSDNHVVIEAGFGPYPVNHTLYDLFLRFEQVGIHLEDINWLLIQVGFDIRSERNARREARVSVDVFARYARDGGDLTHDQQNNLAAKGVSITRILNNHNDFERFHQDVITAFNEA